LAGQDVIDLIVPENVHADCAALRQRALAKHDAGVLDVIKK
jgi:hypothetical protein